MSEVRSRRSEVGGQRSESRDRRSEVGRQKAEDGGQKGELDFPIEEAYSRGFATHGDFGLTLEQFAEHVNSIITKRPGANPEQVAIISFTAEHAEDLYLAAACALNNSDSAWSRFAALYNSYISTVAHSLCSTHQEARDLASSLLAHLFFLDRNGQRRIATYQGRSSLRTWLATIIRRLAINQSQLKWKEAVPLDSLRDTPGASADSELEAALIQNKHREAIADSFRCAVDSLSARERLVLLLRVEDELAAVEIARRLGVHKAQITRAIHRAETKLRIVLFTRLGKHHRLAREAIEECAAQILRHPETSLAAFLRDQ